ncbi:MAG TPA: MarR family transcriptional regulator [Polyangia bacterium]|nr:MarR family transcriptional regulator [Polyangia bacterium]
MSSPPSSSTKKSPPRGSGAPDPFWASLIELCLGMRSWWSAVCEEFELTPSQGMALRSLDPERPLAMSTLADALACDASNVTGIVDKLESRGLIARRGADHDRRIKMLCVTQAGQALRARLIGRLLQPPAAVMSLPREIKNTLTGILRNLLAEQTFKAAEEQDDSPRSVRA